MKSREYCIPGTFGMQGTDLGREFDKMENSHHGRIFDFQDSYVYAFLLTLFLCEYVLELYISHVGLSVITMCDPEGKREGREPSMEWTENVMFPFT